MTRFRAVTGSFIILFLGCSRLAFGAAALDWVTIAQGGQGFTLGVPGKSFTPWGFNYDHDEQGRLLEDYWLTEWPKVVEDFREMRELGANVHICTTSADLFGLDCEELNGGESINRCGVATFMSCALKSKVVLFV